MELPVRVLAVDWIQTVVMLVLFILKIELIHQEEVIVLILEIQSFFVLKLLCFFDLSLLVTTLQLTYIFTIINVVFFSPNNSCFLLEGNLLSVLIDSLLSILLRLISFWLLLSDSTKFWKAALYFTLFSLYFLLWAFSSENICSSSLNNFSL